MRLCKSKKKKKLKTNLIIGAAYNLKRKKKKTFFGGETNSCFIRLHKNKKKAFLGTRFSGFEIPPEPKRFWLLASASPSSFADERAREFESVRDDEVRLQIFSNGTLFISTVIKSDAAKYMCEASNGVGSPLSKIVNLSVTGKHSFKIVGNSFVS